MTKEELKKYFVENAVTNIWKNDLINVLTKAENEMNGAVLFYSINKILPNILIIEDFEVGDFFNDFYKEFEINNDSIIKTEYYNPSEDKLEINYSNLILSKEIVIKYKPNSYGAIIYYSNSINPEIINYFIETAKKYVIKLVNEHPLWILGDNNGKLSAWRTKAPEIKNVDINLSYNDDFSSINETILKRLSQPNDKGILLLHGISGSGKSTYIRYLMSKISKKFIYVPTEYAHYLGTKEFMTLLLDYKDSILIIEDAEGVIKTRTDNTTTATANLLNLGDGLLSDVLSIQIILTFNTELSNIDSALTRKGRVISRYEFRKLSQEKSQKLSDSLGYKSTIKSEMTLAEIYNQDDTDYTGSNKKEIGFSLHGN